MKHIKAFKSFEEHIISICKKFGIRNWTLNEDGSVDVDGDVDFYNKGMEKLPLKFGKVSGFFQCSSNKLTDLEGSPIRVGGRFNCGYNKLTSLEGSPREVGDKFDCGGNKLTSLKGSPVEVGGSFLCAYNKLITLEGGPSKVGGSFDCSYNKLTNLEGCPIESCSNFYCLSNELTSLKGAPKEVLYDFNCGYNNLISLEGAPIEIISLSCYKNPIFNVYCLFPDHKSYIDSLDYGYLRGTNIVRSRFKEALSEIRKRVPKDIPGYKYI